MAENQQAIAVHVSHLSTDQLAFLADEGFAISQEPGWLFFAGTAGFGPDARLVLRAVRPTDMVPAQMRALADENLALVQDPGLLCFVRQAPPDDGERVPEPEANSAVREATRLVETPERGA